MAKNKKQKPVLGMANLSVRNAHARELNAVIVERSRGNGAGTHANAGERRARTREAQLRRALRDE
jgi:hypothetical protein